MDSLNDILSSLTPDDISSLKEMASSLFAENSDEPNQSQNDIFSGINPDMLLKISNVMNMMNSNKGSERFRLIEALKPNLSKKRQKKADEAMQMLRLLEILPMLNLLNPDGDDNGKH